MDMDRKCIWLSLCLWLAACERAYSPEGSAGALASTRDTRAEEGALLAAVRANAGMRADELRARHKHARTQALGFEPNEAQGLSALQASSHALSEPELARLHEQGFVVSASDEFPTMLYGYASLYVQDLPLFVSADSLLDAVFRSYSTMLEQIETQVLSEDLTQLVNGLRDALSRSDGSAEAERQLDLVLAVAHGLLAAEDSVGVAGADDSEIASLTQRVRDAQGHETYVLFASERDIDFSQFKPRGHYTHSPALMRYFQALSWLSRTELRLIETLPSGERVFQPQQLAAATLLRSLLGPDLLALYQRIDLISEAFAGRSDNMTLSDLDALHRDLGSPSQDALLELDAEQVARVILDKGYGAQQIGAQLIVNRSADGRPLPLSRVFALFGQRYSVDAHVLSNVVHDVVPRRVMPNPLDAAFAALGNDAALDRLGPELDTYAGALASTRQLVDALDASYWDHSLNTLWLKALRALSDSDEDAAALPATMRTRAWDARVLNTQLASWAQLRHAAGLYTKPSYTVGLLCEYPDAYVEPYPAFFDALHALAARGTQLAELVGERDDTLGARMSRYFDNFAEATRVLGDMARAQLAGEPFSDEHLAFINNAVSQSDNCPGPATFDGWYAKLDFAGMDSARVPSQLAPVIADIHTQPTDLDGRDVGRILHVGVGLPRLMVVAVPTCHGPRAYAGLASSYRELITDGWQRLDDAQWTDMVTGFSGEPLPEVTWTSELRGGTSTP
jgi:hypothetical protein